MSGKFHCLSGPSKGETFSEWSPQTFCLNNNLFMILSSNIYKAFLCSSFQLFQRTPFIFPLPPLSSEGW